MRKGLFSESSLRPTRLGFLILLALVAVAVLFIKTESALEASGEADDPRLVLMEALADDDLTAAARVFESGVDPSLAIVDAARRGDADDLRWLFDRGAVASGRTGTRALLWALRSDDPELASLVRANGADLDAGDPAGVTLLMSMAAATTKEKRAYRMLSALLDAGADVNVRSFAGRSALMFAVKHDRQKVIRRLLAAGAEVDARDRDGWTPLMLAARDGRLRTVRNLLEAGADPDARSVIGWTPLMWAAWFGHLEVVEKLLEFGADPNLSSYVGGTALVRAVQTGRRRVALALLAAGARSETEFGGLDAAGWASVSRTGYMLRAFNRSAGE